MIDNRKLGCLEQTMEKLNSCAKTWNIVTISRIKGPLSPEVIRQALDIIRFRHPRLNSRIIRLRNSLRFQTEGTIKIPLRVVKKFDHEEWQEVVDEEMNQAIDSSKCLMRAVLVHIESYNHEHYLITTGHHAIADGLSSIQLHSEILTYCQQIISGNLINPVASLLPLPPVEELLPTWTKKFIGKISSTIFLLKLGGQKIWYRPKTLGFEKYVPISHRKCHIIQKQLDKEVTQQLVNCCRQADITVNSALCAAIMLVIASNITKNNRKRINVNCLSYLDLRQRLASTISHEHMAVLASSIMGFYTIHHNKSFWELAREVRQKFEASTKCNDALKMILVAKHLINFSLTFPQQVAATVSVSNAGRINVPKIYGDFELEEISFVGSHGLYAGMFITHATTFRGKMLLNFVFSEPSISRGKMEDIVNQFICYIYDICNINFEQSFTNVQPIIN
ncbi:phthiocerol/phthiodiolone dimycocerosyl transferase family protein [Umezakia ovalisporum]|uniref:Phthiocerol/phthiodiolone dimycocerosyl transferase n=1 Tax=Umezakia ovalisporum FSS-43 TaxID=2740520 RepID=A0ABT6K7T2_9CYAN|nr:condensation domain-containing protein [Umezakia ovalisporum]MDH6058135.1 condensation domain-containing protein [Umezakia ovalisporum FSS-43]MDH6066277.1 condensation domain-containing protein [Umezakia ovalisporum APH033B]MDH6071836.1 condensation domain-containing protein [Umezakia ovalisporum CobakiLakeA]MDH6073581.1 condensation domain-containing protein [Umezakia ovalisporum CS-1034]MDH6079226.1 condensation domain-containing protein [Umezakia ovalisporum FSS-45]